ncbi:MAG: hydroxymethylglutaryl-CoA lyase [Saprospiraceae bacterium]|nr:hydroxymethylglutaryl-CoA lyase [Saprospiraceae bacterium]
MQGLAKFIPTDLKASYINQLLRVGFDTIDFGSFVSPKAIPQMRDTADVLAKLELSESQTKLLAIVANQRGAQDASSHKQISYLGYPFSVSQTFQLRNTNATIEESLERVKDIQEICVRTDKKLVVYLSMGFGNPYGDPWNVEIVQRWVDILADMDIKILALSDTIGVSTPESITYLFSNLIPPYPDVEFGAHLHTTPSSWYEKVDAAYRSGCRRFDSTIRGYGGCPMAKDELTGNMATENLIEYLNLHKISFDINQNALMRAMDSVLDVFPSR